MKLLIIESVKIGGSKTGLVQSSIYVGIFHLVKQHLKCFFLTTDLWCTRQRPGYLHGTKIGWGTNDFDGSLFKLKTKSKKTKNTKETKTHFSGLTISVRNIGFILDWTLKSETILKLHCKYLSESRADQFETLLTHPVNSLII